MPPQINYPEILLTVAGEQIFVQIEEIMYLEAKGSYTDIYLADGQKCRISKKLKLALKILNADYFVRIHHSYALNLKYLAGFCNGDSASVKLKDGSQLPLSRSRKTDFLSFFKRL
ncbi:LytR/AlgR family response regulator transcription factor [Flavilitoribacter nigricans]|nr:LytTR family DNA-binding domain-containing protein [Flavilitoribacter nigricans]